MMGPRGPKLNWNKFPTSCEIGPIQVKWWYQMFSSIKMEECMKSKLPGFFWAKLVAKNIVFGLPRTHFMHMRAKSWKDLLDFQITSIRCSQLFFVLMFTYITVFKFLSQISTSRKQFGHKISEIIECLTNVCCKIRLFWYGKKPSTLLFEKFLACCSSEIKIIIAYPDENGFNVLFYMFIPPGMRISISGYIFTLSFLQSTRYSNSSEFTVQQNIY